MGSGTAFALDNQGRWMTARHVVDGCKRVFIAMPPAASGKVRYWLKTDNVKLPLVPTRSITEDQRADLAILQTQEVHSEAMAIEGGGAGSDVVGQQGFSIGFPGGEPGQASVKLLGYGMSVMHLGKDWVKSPNMIWAVKELHSSTGKFNGISGGPLLNPLGKVVGVNSSASERRGRLNTVAPESLSLLSGEHVKNPVGGIYSPVGPIDDATYVDTADGLRKRYTIAAVYCVYR